MKFLFPTTLIVAAIMVFYFFSDPTYQEVKTLITEKQSYSDALDNSKKLQSVRDELLAKYNSFPANSLERLEKMVPNNVDNVRLVLEIDRIASNYGMSIKNIKLGTSNTTKKDANVKDIIGKDEKPYGTVSLEFSLEGPFQNFASFVGDLEKSLRIVDITGISFSTSDDKGTSQYNVRLNTYWLR